MLGVELNEDPGYREVANPNGKLIKRFQIIDPVMEADAVIVVSKLKTHLLTNMTAATKNLFGVIPGMEKASFHGRLEDPLDFSRMLVDLNELVRPTLQIIDAVVAMEGDGPNSGDPRKVGAILASPSYAAADVAAARLIGFDPMSVPTVLAALERGILDDNLGITIKGGSIDDLKVPDFRPPSTYVGGKRQSDGMLMRKMSKMMKAYALRPKIDRTKCTGCERCVRACPTQTIVLRQGRAMVKHRDCIACYTCHEMCNNEAIKLERTLTGKLMASLMERKGGKKKE
jgi:ferredoxin